MQVTKLVFGISADVRAARRKRKTRTTAPVLPEDGIVRGTVGHEWNEGRVTKRAVHAARQSTTACNMNYRGYSGRVCAMLKFGGYVECDAAQVGTQVDCPWCRRALGALGHGEG